VHSTLLDLAFFCWLRLELACDTRYVRRQRRLLLLRSARRDARDTAMIVARLLWCGCGGSAPMPGAASASAAMMLLLHAVRSTVWSWASHRFDSTGRRSSLGRHAVLSINQYVCLLRLLALARRPTDIGRSRGGTPLRATAGSHGRACSNLVETAEAASFGQADWRMLRRPPETKTTTTTTTKAARRTVGWGAPPRRSQPPGA
jgi:hypothetical protein